MKIKKVIFIDGIDVYRTFSIACTIGETLGFSTLTKEIYDVAKHINKYIRRIENINSRKVYASPSYQKLTDAMIDNIKSDILLLTVSENRGLPVKYTIEYKEKVLTKLIYRFHGGKTLTIKDADKIF